MASAVAPPAELASVPWPTLVIGADGAALASESAVRVLGFSPHNVRELEERVEVLSSAGAPLPGDAWPWRRVARGESFEDDERWRDRITGARSAVRVRARVLDAAMLVDLEPQSEAAEHFMHQQLAALNEALFTPATASEPLSLRDVLLRLVQLACQVADARYGALGVLDRDGRKLKDFIFTGVSEDTARTIGHLPSGHGLLGAVIREGRPIRVARIADDSRSEGFPPGHPPMTSFVGVPLRVGFQVFGNLYLADKRSGDAFTEEDEQLLQKFSDQAGLTVAYARQLEDEERLLLQAVVEHAPYGLAYFPADREAEPFGNPAARRMLGRITRADDPDRTFELNYPDGRPMPPEALPVARALREGVVINVETVIERREGGTFHGEISAAPVHSRSGVRLGVVVVYQDISARKDLERMRDEFAAIVAHDLRTPLQSVLMQLDLLLAQASGGASTVSIATLQSMKRNSSRLERLTRDLLDASGIDARRLVLDRHAVSAVEIVQALAAEIQGTLGTHPLSVEVIGAPPPINADRLRIEQVLTNLLENSSKYSAEGAPIRVAIAAAHQGVEISIEDHGPGIAPEEIPHLFDRYFQTRKARGTRRGLGLGLYIARGFVEAHGGTISVESTPGTGSVFRIWLPAAGS
jgi:signal transduction histidine kinase